jgi:ABC-type sugar transport system ATPase subunit
MIAEPIGGEAAMHTASVATPLCKLTGLGKRFGSTWACRNIDLTLRPGEVHALLGENGAGKSTLIKVLHGHYRPDEGHIEISGRAVDFTSPREAEAAGIVAVRQELDLFPDLTIAENLFVGRPRPRTRWGRFDWQSMRRQARDIFHTLGVDLDVASPAHTLSGAHKQMVEIARALLRDARIVLMDEPTAALTDRETQCLFAFIRELTARGVSVIYISHRLEEIFEIADSVTVMRDGGLVGHGPMSEMTLPQLVQLMIGRPLEKLFQRTSHQPGDLLLEVRRLGRSRVFRDVSFKVRGGEIVGLYGLIGAGRSELAQTIVGLDTATTGEICVRGRLARIDNPRAAIQHGVVYVPEERRSQGLFLDFPSEWNISFASLQRLSRWGWVIKDKEQALAARFRETLAIRGDRPAAPVYTLSGGNQQKVLLAKSLALEPDVILLDEPTRGVDVGAKAEIYRIIDELARAGKAVLMISSDMVELLSISDRILVMRQGELMGEFAGPDFPVERIGQAAMGAVS